MMHIESGIWWTIGLSVVVTLLFVLPLLPALLELQWPQDATPLRVVREYDSNVANFAHGFEHFIEKKFAHTLGSLAPDDIRLLDLDGGGRCVLMGKAATFSLDAAQSSSLTVQHLLVCAGDVRLPDHVLYEAEVYAGADFFSGAMSAFRAVLAKGRAVVGRDSVVLRWIHADELLQVGPAVQLFGRASSDHRMELGAGVVFERLHAPSIVFGEAPAGVGPLPNLATSAACEDVLGRTAELRGGLLRVAEDLALPPASLCAERLVVQSNVQVGAQSWLQHALKGNGKVILQAQCRVDDAVVATGAIDIGRDCQIKGPIISESQVLVRRGSVVGTAALPTTISAPRIVVETGVVVHGSVWAREQGQVLAEAQKEPT